MDLTHNTQLSELHCESNKLTDLDLTHNTQLNELHCESNKLTDLDLTHNTQLSNLSCHNNQASIQSGTSLETLQTQFGFDVNKVSNVRGGKFENGKVIFTKATMSYIYDCGNGKQERFTMLTKHLAELVPGKQPTVAEDGWKDYWRCKLHKNEFFEDETCETRITNLDEWKTG